MSNNNYIISNYRDGIRTITIKRPERKNALCTSMYQTITRILTEDASNDRVVVTIITGYGSYFSSGNDIKAAMFGEISMNEGLNSFKELVNTLINYPKLLIAVVNGPAVGIGATMAALCDIVYAADTAVFDTPFVKLGLCAEAASSYTFPQILGRSKASEVILLNHKLNAQEAHQFGLVSRVIPQSALDEFIVELRRYGKLPVQNLIRNKRLIMSNFKRILCECNEREIDELIVCAQSEEFVNAVTTFMHKKSKL
ncbi:hypothetical protein NQ315_000920 [Exocentrus adspersus]|uniref:Enoyl-CoA hydratase n=1 Tax=Exocentrus adspersus TaxID=1586481 RepID=A0AAV8WDU6_9CUCU|nr:hypothetical protein NQ315_000920 [Exocentrus adspersus]